MRLTKGMKKILSLALTGALVITGANILGEKEVEAAGLPNGIVGEAGEAIDTPFSIALHQNGNICDWAGEPFAVADEESEIKEISKTGRYQVSATATKDMENMVDASSCGVVWLATSLKDVPATFGVVGETVAVGETTYDFNQSAARLYNDNGEIRVGIANQWGDAKANTMKEGTTIPVKAGDVVTVTFKVFLGDPAGEVPADPKPSTGESASLPYGLVEGTEGEAISVPFKAGIDSWGSITNDWGPVPNAEACLEISKTGEYKLSTVSELDVDDLRTKNGGIDICTDLAEMPKDFDIVGETVQIGDTVYELDQEWARVYSDNGSIRTGICNGYNSNPWANSIKSDSEVEVFEGDVVTITFKVVNQKPAGFGEEEEPTTEPTAEPTVAPSAEPTVVAPTTNACKKVTPAKKTVSVKRGKSTTLTFKLTNADASKVTTDKITVKSSNKKVTAKVLTKKTTAKKVFVKVTVNKKAKKKSKAVITLKVGSKSAKTTIKVK